MKVLPFDGNSVYCGEVKKKNKQDISDGMGKYVDPSGNIYIGEFKNHEYNGRGIFFYNNNNVNRVHQLPYTYEGDWENNMRHGHGKMVFLNNDEFEGEFQYDEIHGNGKYVFNNGDYYIGQFSCGNLHGQGILYRSDHKRLYSGEWRFDTFNGKGTYYYSNGIKEYEGYWKDGLAHGIGVLYDKEGTIRFYGIYDNGERKQSLVEENIDYEEDIDIDILDPVVQENIKKNIANLLKTPDIRPITPLVTSVDNLMLSATNRRCSSGDISVKENPLKNIKMNHFTKMNSNRFNYMSIPCSDMTTLSEETLSYTQDEPIQRNEKVKEIINRVDSKERRKNNYKVTFNPVQINNTKKVEVPRKSNEYKLESVPKPSKWARFFKSKQEPDKVFNNPLNSKTIVDSNPLQDINGPNVIAMAKEVKEPGSKTILQFMKNIQTTVKPSKVVELSNPAFDATKQPVVEDIGKYTLQNTSVSKNNKNSGQHNPKLGEKEKNTLSLPLSIFKKKDLFNNNDVEKGTTVVSENPLKDLNIPIKIPKGTLQDMIT